MTKEQQLRQFSADLLQVGAGRFPHADRKLLANIPRNELSQVKGDSIMIPLLWRSTGRDLTDMINDVYDGVEQFICNVRDVSAASDEYFATRAVLAAKNDCI